jgi:phosphoribosylanthranilate isomerase
MFRIKICGITNERDALAAAEAGADAIGLNFFPRSRRFIEPETARQISVAVPAGILKVGVFVNHAAAEISSIVARVGLDAVQLHGDEPPQIIAELPKNVRVLRAHRCGSDGLQSLAQFLIASRAAGRMPDAILVDADAGSDFGGTGQRADWDRVTREREALQKLPLLLAGGLTPENVAAAIAAVGPAGVDVASGVEREPGIKDPKRVAEFIAAATQGFASSRDANRGSG